MEIGSQYNLQNITLKTEFSKTEKKTQKAYADKLKADFFGVTAEKGEKVALKEGINIFLKGAKTNFLNVGKEIKEHPFRTAIVAVSTAVALSTLPLVGITVASGAALLAGVFGVIAGVKVVRDVSKIAKFNKEGNYNKVRTQIKQLGGDTFDLALVLPFMPRGFTQFKNQIKLKQAFRINGDLLSDVKKAGDFVEKAAMLLDSNINLVQKQYKLNMLKPGFLTRLTEPITSKIPVLNKILFNNAVNSVYGTFMGVGTSASLIAKRAKEIGLGDENCKIIEGRAMDAAKILTMSPWDRFLNIFGSNKK